MLGAIITIFLERACDYRHLFNRLTRVGNRATTDACSYAEGHYQFPSRGHVKMHVIPHLYYTMRVSVHTFRTDHYYVTAAGLGQAR